jgi:hypothetical protein
MAKSIAFAADAPRFTHRQLSTTTYAQDALSCTGVFNFRYLTPAAIGVRKQR